MKWAAAAAAASAAATAVASAATAATAAGPSPTGSPASREDGGWRRRTEERFAPRFDGLRFIETLVTAHR
uniref:Secreted protein n=1 Tax=Leersia perrieri TaxID=77586 RepID=A0A0D9XHY5_9ORYZ